jgi:hypothetical protein
MDNLSGAVAGGRNPFPGNRSGIGKSFSSFYYGCAGAVKVTRQKYLDFHGEKRFDSQLDDLVQRRKDKKW